MLITQGPLVKNMDTRWGITLRQILQEVRSMCKTRNQSATLSSVAIDELFGSVLNSDPKLLAFTDSVQDASHRAGFFTARTYAFTFRTALQHVIDDAGPAGVPLT